MCDMTHSHVNELCYTWMRRVTHVTRMDLSCHTYEASMSHIHMIYVAHKDESCHTSNALDESCHTSKDESCHTSKDESCHTSKNESCHTSKDESCHTSNAIQWESAVLDVHETCDMTHLYVQHKSCLCVAWILRMYMTRQIHTCDMCDMAHSSTHSYVILLIQMWRDACICDTTHSYIAQLIHVWYCSSKCGVTFAYVRRLIHI